MSISIFWDNSNIWLVGRNVCKQRELGDQNDFRIHFAHMLDFIQDGRDVDFAFVGGSVPPNNDPLWQRFDDLGINVVTQERGETTGGEIAVDEIIQLQMANRILDADTPGTIVLCTGDGSGYTEGKGFIKQLERAKKHRWQIEVVSWDAGCNRFLRHFAQNEGSYRSLESVYNNVTFINNKRWSLGVN